MKPRMEWKAWVTMALLVTLILVGCRPSTPVPQEAPAGGNPASGPRIAMEKDYLDFGKVAYDQVVRARFPFRNVGDAPLILKEASVSVLEGC